MIRVNAPVNRLAPDVSMQGSLLLQFSTMKTLRVNMLRRMIEHCWTPSDSGFIQEFKSLLGLFWVQHFNALNISYMQNTLKMPDDDVQDLMNTALLMGAVRVPSSAIRNAIVGDQYGILYFTAEDKKKSNEYERFAGPIIGRHLTSRLLPVQASEREMLLHHLTNRLDLSIEFDTRRPPREYPAGPL